MTRDPRIQVRLATSGELAEPIALLEEFLREGEPVPPPFAERLAWAVEGGDLELLVARPELDRPTAGVAVLAFRPSVALGATFASIEDLYVRPDARGQGVGQALLEAVEERCLAHGISYVEVQTDDEAAPFYEALGYELEAGLFVLSSSLVL